MKLTFAAFVLTGLLSVSQASPRPNNGGTITVSASAAPITTQSAIVSFSVSSAPYPPGGWGGGGTISYAYPTSAPAVCYSAVPYPPPTSSPGGITTTRFPGPSATFTGPWSSFATLPTVSSSIAHENWGKPTYTITSVYATATSGYPICPPGYTSSTSGVDLPGGTLSASTAPSPTFISTSNAAPAGDPSATPNAQNLNADNKPTGAAAASFKLSFAATLVGSIVTAALAI
ncbi:hypothetical protein BJ165DRAFT_1533845 [Panaeolus papilionaceus]|nr:hypothetical protein BJ165DRAFT_1533845 [Panaeolus papilionaceus]